MIDFIYKLNEILPSWPVNTKWSLQQISQVTETSIPHVLQYLSEGLGKELDVAGNLSLEEASEALGTLTKRMRPMIEQREREIAERKMRAVALYHRMMERVNELQISGQWHTAFRTLSYFAGEHERDIPREQMITLCSDIIRSGMKCQSNMQELGRWLQKGVAYAVSAHNREGIEEALDLIDAYGDYFLTEDSGKGPLLIGNILAVLEEPAARFELWEQFKALVGNLYPES